MVTAYPQPGKAKSMEICRAFVKGCGGAIAHNADALLPGTAFFYGISDANAHLWRAARKRGDYLYADNSYYDETRQAYFRVTRDALQHSGYGTSSGARFAALGLDIKPWGIAGEHVVVCPQSEHFMRTIVGYPGDWLWDTLAKLKEVSNRPVKVRVWSRDKAAIAATLQADLVNAYALVTHSSAAAVTALLAGVPVVSTGQESAASRMSGSLAYFDALPHPPRASWAGVLADNQWTLAEMASGLAWQTLQTCQPRDEWEDAHATA